MEQLANRGLMLLGCGKMGSAMLAGWLKQGIAPEQVWVQEPSPSPWLQNSGVRLNQTPEEAPALVLIAVKPQSMESALPELAAYGGGDTLFLSVAAGIGLSRYEAALGEGTPVIRAMPNTPAAIGQGITAIIGNSAASPAQLDLAANLLKAIGEVVRLESESQLDAVTGLSGSGPAYVFHMIECLTRAGQAQGLSADLAHQLATATVAGAGALAAQSGESPAQLRVNVTSPNGTTQAGLEVLMDETTGLPPLITRTVAAAANRSRELANG